ncbi:MAG: DUF1848 domain-containing protein [Succinivibrionaceae bacterium]|nr:DUF1848 domain-containing protein [Succinivibrionaceae bacterium]
MAAKSKETELFTLDDGTPARALHPVVLSASRATDLPAFYADWLFSRLRLGFCEWRNPFNGERLAICLDRVRFIVFWSKNPRPLLRFLPQLRDLGIGCYVQYTLNDYEREGLEPRVPPLERRLETFLALEAALGAERVIWRFDPLLLTPALGEDELLGRIGRIGERLRGHAERLIFSFADIAPYPRVARNLRRLGIGYVDWDEGRMRAFAGRLVPLARGLGLEPLACAEGIELEGVGRSSCVDRFLMARISAEDHGGEPDPVLLSELGLGLWRPQGGGLFAGFGDEPPAGAVALPGGAYVVPRRKNKDPGQRRECGCARSKDIGMYNTCPHQCAYCYANTSPQSALENYRRLRGEQAPVGFRSV